MGGFDFFRKITQGLSSSYVLRFATSAFDRVKVAIMMPFRRLVRKSTQIFNASLMTTKLIEPINQKIRKILGAEAKSPEDYFTIAGFWISKYLVYFVILGACAAVLLYFSATAPKTQITTTTETRVTDVTYDYDDMDLATYSGKANIKAESGAVVYTGDIDAGFVTGYGTLWNQNGTLVYEGDFVNNAFEGKGTRYFATGNPQYKGDFVANTFEGEGVLYFSDGTKQYEGGFVAGEFSGEGVLYGKNGTVQYEGAFLNGKYHGEGTSYYENGCKKYTGEFAYGMMQGTGTLYTSAGQVRFAGSFVRNQIQYESLAGCTLEDAMAALGETPIVYYSDKTTCFLFANTGIILKTDCQVKMLRRDVNEGGEVVWFLENEDDVTLSDTDNVTGEDTSNAAADQIAGQIASGWDVKSSTSAELANQIAALPSQNSYSPWYYLERSDEWLSEENLLADLSKVTVTAISAFGDQLDVAFLREEDYTPKNGAAELLQCVSIDQIRLNKPTAFSSINYGLTYHNSYYIYVNDMNLGGALYEEVYEIDTVRYHLYYQMDDPDTLMFVTYELR